MAGHDRGQRLRRRARGMDRTGPAAARCRSAPAHRLRRDPRPRRRRSGAGGVQRSGHLHRSVRRSSRRGRRRSPGRVAGERRTSRRRHSGRRVRASRSTPRTNSATRSRWRRRRSRRSRRPTRGRGGADCSDEGPRGPRSASRPDTSTGTRCGCRAASAPRPGSRSPCSYRASSMRRTPSGSGSARCRCCARTRLSTGATVLRALLGTVVGFAIGGGLVAIIGTNHAVLWTLFPIVIFVAASAPALISFVAGQAAFTVFTIILFNIIAPAGWQIGVVRVEDVALGCASSLVAGFLFWPRGAAAALGTAYAEAYSTAARFLRQSIAALDDRTTTPDAVGDIATAAGARLDDALRQYLAEQGTKRVPLDSVATLAGGATRRAPGGRGDQPVAPTGAARRRRPRRRQGTDRTRDAAAAARRRRQRVVCGTGRRRSPGRAGTLPPLDGSSEWRLVPRRRAARGARLRRSRSCATSRTTAVVRAVPRRRRSVACRSCDARCAGQHGTRTQLVATLTVSSRKAVHTDHRLRREGVR